MSRWGVRGVVAHRGRHRVLDDVTLEVWPEAVAAVVGGDGAGKTSLLHVLAGTLAPDAGAVSRPAPTRVGGQLGSAGVWDDLTVDENLAFVAACYRMDPAAAASRADALTLAAGLTGARERLAAALSGGMRQKLGVCAALLPHPALVLLDEPTTGVDPVSRAQLWRLITRAAAEGAAVVLTTTHLDEAERAAAVLVLEHGRELVAGAPTDLIAAHPGQGGLEGLVIAAQRAREGMAA